MNTLHRIRPWLAALLVGALAACGGGGRDEVLGFNGVPPVPPTVTAVTPVNNATGVPIANPAISATFSEPMAALTGTATFTVTCAAPCLSPAGAVALDSTGRVANFTLASGSALANATTYTATVTGARSLATGLPLAAPYTWQFSTAAAPPTVTAVAPINNATGVAVNNTVITAAFSEPMAPISGAASFVVTCAAPCVSPTGTVALDPTNRIATLSLTSGTTLASNTTYTATVTAAKSLATGLTLVNPYVWHFTTGVLPDTTRPRVTLTVPATTSPGPTAGVPTNTAISAVFTEEMAPITITPASFTLSCAAPCVVPSGTVTYVVGARTAVFTPAAVLTANSTYTATITTAATDLAGNALAGNQAALPAASNYVWTFTTAAAPIPPANISVQLTNPANLDANVCPDDTVNATFSVPSGLRMDPLTVNSGTFTLTSGQGASVVSVQAQSVVLDAATGKIATFTPLQPFTPGTVYTATIKGGVNGVKDLAVPANTMAVNKVWTFTAGTCAAAVVPPLVPLRSAASFGAFGGSAGITSQGLITVVNGDIGTTAVSTTVTGFHDDPVLNCTYTETPLNFGTVNGKIYTAPPPPTVFCPGEGTAVTFAIATQARADALAAYNQLVAMPGGPDPGAGNLANLTLAPGTYTAAAGSFKIEGGDLTLDAHGNANATWVFQMATSLTVGGPGVAFPQSIILANGALAKNVFWQVGTAATINAGGGGTMAGTIISQAGAVISTAGKIVPTTINGRVLSLGASVTMVNTVINVPAP